MIKLKRIIYASLFYIYNAFITNIPSYKFRRIYLIKLMNFKIHKTASIHMGCFFTGSRFIMHANSVINRNCYLDCREGIEIHSNVSISPECYIISSGHDPQSPHFDGKGGNVTIEDYAWLGARTILLPNITISKGTVSGAGSVITKTTEPFTIVGGNPAKAIKKRNEDLRYTINWFPYFNTDVQS